MTSPVSGPSSNGASSPSRPDGRGQSRELSISSPARTSQEYKSSGDAMSGGFDSPRSSVSTSSIESPSSSNMMSRSLSGKLKPKKSQSAYYDEESGTWKCRNCGGTYDLPNPGSRQRREHKKACEETQRLQEIKRVADEKARREEAAREAALRAQGIEEASKRQEALRGVSTAQGNAGAVSNDPSIVGVFNKTPVIPEVEEVNFEAPQELIHEMKRDSAGHLRESQLTVDVESSQYHNQFEQEHGQVAALHRSTDNYRMEATRAKDLASKDGLQPTAQGDKLVRNGIEPSGELKPVNSTPTPDRAPRNGFPGLRRIDETSLSPESRSADKFEQAKYHSTTAPKGAHLEGTLYHRLVDLHDDPRIALTGSASLGRGRTETSQVASTTNRGDTAVGGERKYTRAFSLDHYGVELENRKVSSRKPDRVREDFGRDESSRDTSPEELIEALIGRDHYRAPRPNHGVETKQDRSKAPANGIAEGRIGRSPDAFPCVACTVTTRVDIARAKDPSGGSSQARDSDLKRARSYSTQRAAAERDNSRKDRRPPSPAGDGNLCAVVVRAVGKYWKQAASLAGVAVIAWIGQSLANRQQRQRRLSVPEPPPHRCRSARCPLEMYYWDD